MNLRQFHPFSPGPLSPSEVSTLDEMARVLTSLSNVTFQPPITGVVDHGGIRIGAEIEFPEPSPIYVLVIDGPTGSAGTGPYQGVLSTPDGFAWVNGTDVVDARAINDELLTAGDRYRGDLVGYAADGTPEYRVVATCCSPGGSGGSGGSGGGVITACCQGEAIPLTLYYTMTGSGICDGTRPLHWQSGSTWVTGTGGTTPMVGSCNGVAALGSLSCSGGVWTFGAAGSSGAFVLSSSSCSPFRLVFSTVGGVSTCGCSGPITYTITDYDPSAPDCFTGTCAGSRTATITSAVGCFASAPGTVTLACTTLSGPTRFYSATLGSAVCGDTSMTIYQDGVPTLNFGSRITTADAGYSCGPDAWMFHVDDFAGNSCVVTVS